jgi:hypothetical protein
MVQKSIIGEKVTRVSLKIKPFLKANEPPKNRDDTNLSECQAQVNASVVSLNETIEISSGYQIKRKWAENDEDDIELEGALAPIKCDDEGPDFSKMETPAKANDKG